MALFRFFHQNLIRTPIRLCSFLKNNNTFLEDKLNLLRDDTKSISNMTNQESLNLFQEFSKLDSKIPQNIESLKVFENHYSLNIKTFSDTELESLIYTIVHLSNLNHTFTKDFISKVLERIRYYNLNYTTTIDILKQLTSYLQQAKSSTNSIYIDILFSISSRISKKFLQQIDIKTLADIVEMFSYCYYNKISVKIFTGGDLYKECQDLIISNKKNYKIEDVKHYGKILKFFIANRKGLHLFLEILEGFVFKNLDKFTTKEIFDLISEYNKRYILDYEYIIYEITRPVVNIFIERFDTLSPNEIVH